MPSISLKAHYDGMVIRLDEPFDLPKGAQLIVIVLDSTQPEKDRAGWAGLGARGLARSYGDVEPEYSVADVLP